MVWICLALIATAVIFSSLIKKKNLLNTLSCSCSGAGLLNPFENVHHVYRIFQKCWRKAQWMTSLRALLHGLNFVSFAKREQGRHSSYNRTENNSCSCAAEFRGSSALEVPEKYQVTWWSSIENPFLCSLSSNAFSVARTCFFRSRCVKCIKKTEQCTVPVFNSVRFVRLPEK